MKLTLGQAAEYSKISKSTLSRYIRSGRLSGTLNNETKSYEIDPSEIDRLIDSRKNRDGIGTLRKEQPATPPETPNSTALAQVEIAFLKEKNELLKIQNEEIKTDRDEWKKQAQQLVLTYQPQKPPEKPIQEQVDIPATQHQKIERRLLSESIRPIEWIILLLLTIFIFALAFFAFKVNG